MLWNSWINADNSFLNVLGGPWYFELLQSQLSQRRRGSKRPSNSWWPHPTDKLLPCLAQEQMWNRKPLFATKSLGLCFRYRVHFEMDAGARCGHKVALAESIWYTSDSPSVCEVTIRGAVMFRKASDFLDGELDNLMSSLAICSDECIGVIGPWRASSYCRRNTWTKCRQETVWKRDGREWKTRHEKKQYVRLCSSSQGPTAATQTHAQISRQSHHKWSCKPNLQPTEPPLSLSRGPFELLGKEKDMRIDGYVTHTSNRTNKLVWLTH